MAGFYLGRVPQTDDELYWYVRLRFGVAVPRTRVCAGHVSPFEAFADAFFARNSLAPDSDVDSIALWHGSRGLSGKSYTLSLLAVTMAELLGADVNLLGGSLAQSMNIHEHVGVAMQHENAPEYMVVDASSSRIQLSNGSRIRPLTASQKTVRGPHPPRLLLDEIDEMDLKILDAALGQPLPQRNYLRQTVRPYTVMCSTWQNPQGTFTEIQRRAEEKGYPIYQWCYRESANEVDGWLDQETIEKKKNDTSKAMWDTEYELNEPSIGTRAFDSDAIEATFSLPFTPLATKESKDYWEYTFEKPSRSGTYIAAADWGKEKDYTVITVARIDRPKRRVVYWCKMNRRPYPLMIGKFNEQINRYHADAVHDATGLGDVIDDYLLGINAEGFKMVGAQRADMLTQYVNAVEKDAWRVPKIKDNWLAHRYCQVQDLYSSSKEFHLPDEVCSMALLEWLAHTRAPLAGPIDVGRSTEPTKMSMSVDFDPNELSPGAPRRMGDVTVRRWDDRPSGLSLTV